MALSLNKVFGPCTKQPLLQVARAMATGAAWQSHVSRPRRSMLFLPGSNARALVKAQSVAADSLILDLEDAVAPSAKEVARAQVAAAVKDRPFGLREVTVRVNGLDTPWGLDDVRAIVPAQPDMVILPKVEKISDVAQLATLMDDCGGKNIPIGCMIETPRGVLAANEVALSSNRVICLIAGTSDLTSDLHSATVPSRAPLLTSLSLILLAGRAAGVAVIDGVHLDLGDTEGFARACVQAKEMGFDGKTLIHPKTIAESNKVFSPTTEDVTKAREIIAAYEEAAANKKGIATLNGKLIENLHAASARRLVEFAEAVERLTANQ